MNSPDPHDPLSRTLDTWRVQPAADAGFRPAVWARIERARGDTWLGYLRSTFGRWALVGALAVVGAGWGGRLAAEAQLAARRDQMAVSYLGALDPRVLANAGR